MSGITQPPPFPKQYALKSNNNSTQRSSVFVGLVIPGVLDTSKLETAHRTLVRQWPALGGKLITSTQPYSFTSGDTVNFKSRFLPQSLSEIELVSFNATTSKAIPTVHRITVGVDQLFHFDNVNTYSPPDTLFALRVTVLLDATLLGFRFAHHLCDGQAVYEAILAFSNVLNNLPIPTLIHPPDIHRFLSEEVHAKNCRSPGIILDIDKPGNNVTVGLLGVSLYIIVLLLRMVMIRVGLKDGDEERMIYVPSSFVDRLREECQHEIDSDVDDVVENRLEITKNDILTAWLFKSSYSKFSGENVGVDIMTSFNFRSCLPPLPHGATYLHNSFYNLRTPFTLAELQSLPLSYVALELRKTILNNKQPSAVKAMLQFREQVNGPTAPHPPGRKLAVWGDEMCMVSHWTRFEYVGVDFSGGLSDNGKDLCEVKERGKVVFVLPLTLLPFGLTTRPFALVTKDGNSGYWLRVRLSMLGWKGFENDILI